MILGSGFVSASSHGMGYHRLDRLGRYRGPAHGFVATIQIHHSVARISSGRAIDPTSVGAPAERN